MANAAEKNSADTQRDLAAAMSTLASRPAPTGKRPLTGRERAAVLMLALGEQYGAKIWGMLDDDELRELSVAMSAIGAIEADVVENLLLEFVTRMSASGALMGSYEATERLLQQYLPPERVGAIMEQIRGPAGRNMWEKLSNVQEEVLANYLQERVPANCRGRALQDQAGARRTRARHSARGPRARCGQPHAAHGGGAERGSRARRADAAHGIHVESLADPPPGRTRGDGRDLQQLRSADRKRDF